MKKIVLLTLVSVLIALGASWVRAAEGPTLMEQIQERNKIISEATKLIEKDKKNAEAYYARGSAHFQLGQLYIIIYGPSYSKDQNRTIKAEFEAAVADLTVAINLKEDLLGAYITRGMAYGQMKLSAAAIADFSHVISVDPKNAGAYYVRGREYWANGDYVKAKEDYDTAVELDPQWKDNFYK